jgi:aromatic ring hydroxylase
MEEWVQRLHELVQYWKARKQADLATHVAVKQANHRLVPLHDAYHDKSDHSFPEENMALFMDEVEEVDELRTIANSQIWNYCTVSGCQNILVSFHGDQRGAG